MNYKSFIAFFTAILTSLSCLAQSTPTPVTEDFRPASTNQQGKQYPRVNSERRVRTSFTAPDAQKVQLDIGGKKYDMVIPYCIYSTEVLKMKPVGWTRGMPT